jgi:hypothetical protein
MLNRTSYYRRPATVFVILTSSTDLCDAEDFIALTTYRFRGEGHSSYQWNVVFAVTNLFQPIILHHSIYKRTVWKSREVEVWIGKGNGENSWSSQLSVLGCGLVAMFWTISDVESNYRQIAVIASYSSSRNSNWWEDTAWFGQRKSTLKWRSIVVSEDINSSSILWFEFHQLLWVTNRLHRRLLRKPIDRCSVDWSLCVYNVWNPFVSWKTVAAKLCSIGPVEYCTYAVDPNLTVTLTDLRTELGLWLYNSFFSVIGFSQLALSGIKGELAFVLFVPM